MGAEASVSPQRVRGAVAGMHNPNMVLLCTIFWDGGQTFLGVGRLRYEPARNTAL